MHELNILIDNIPARSRADILNALDQEHLISLVVQSSSGDITRTVVLQVHSVAAFWEWLEGAHARIEDDDAPQYLPPQPTLAEAIECFYAHASDDELDMYEADLRMYRSSHDLRFAFRGTDIPSILLGRWGGSVTLSSTSEEGYSYEISLPKFVSKQ